MPRSRAYVVLLVGIALLTLCEPFTTKVILAQPIDAAVDVIWIFVQCAAAFCVGVDVRDWLRERRRARW